MNVGGSETYRHHQGWLEKTIPSSTVADAKTTAHMAKPVAPIAEEFQTRMVNAIYGTQWRSKFPSKQKSLVTARVLGQSIPDGKPIYLDGKDSGKKSPSTFVVAPGDYEFAVECSNDSKALSEPKTASSTLENRSLLVLVFSCK